MSEERLHGEKLRELRSTSRQKPDPGTRDAEAGGILLPPLAPRCMVSTTGLQRSLLSPTCRLSESILRAMIVFSQISVDDQMFQSISEPLR